MGAGGPTGIARARTPLATRIRNRREVIERALLTRIYGVSDTSGVGDLEYAEGLRAAVPAALEYGILAIEHDDERTPVIPSVLLEQARTAARAGIGIDTVLRRYFGGYALLCDFLIEEAAKEDLLSADALKELLRGQATHFDRLLAAIGEEHARESHAHAASAKARLAQRVQRLLNGEILDTSTLGYDLGRCHIGIAASGPDALRAVHSLCELLDPAALIVPRSETVTWAWLGGDLGLDSERLAETYSHLPAGTAMGIGEQAEGLSGWRRTHAQASAALSVAVRKTGGVIRYAEVARIASMLEDDLLCASLQAMYLEPLSGERDGGATLYETLNAYFAAQRNVSSAAALLGVSRRTVSNRLQVVEDRLGQPLSSVLPDVEAALCLQRLGGMRSYRAAAHQHS